MHLLLLFCLFVLTTGCRSDAQKVDDVARAFVEAHEGLGASFRAYTFLTRADQSAVPAEEFDVVFPANPIFRNGQVTVNAPVIEGDTARVLVTLKSFNDDAIIEHTYVLHREDGSWRVHLGLLERNRIRGELERSKALAKEGNIDDAREVHRNLTRAPFDFSRPESLLEMADSLDVWLEEGERVVGLTKSLSQVRTQTGPPLRSALEKIATQLRPEDVEQRKQLDELQAGWRADYQKSLFDALPDPSWRVRRVTRDGTLKRELMLKVVNTTPHALIGGSVGVAYRNDDEDLGHREFTLPEMKMDEELDLVFELDPAPAGWKGRKIHVEWRSIDLPEDL